VSAAQYAVTAAGVAAIIWVLWYFLPSKRSAAAAASVVGVQEVRITGAERRPATSPHEHHE